MVQGRLYLLEILVVLHQEVLGEDSRVGEGIWLSSVPQASSCGKLGEIIRRILTSGVVGGRRELLDVFITTRHCK